MLAYRTPGAPVISSAMPGNGQATVAFAPSAADQRLGNPITSYTVTARPGVNVTSGPGITAAGTGSPVTVTGLTNGQNYTVTVYATNRAGNGPQSAPSVVFPQAVPGAPTNVSAVTATPAGAGTVNLSFNAPADNGGRPVLSYTAVSSPGGIAVTPGAVTGSSTASVQVTGLTLGTSYTFTVTATNADGGTSQPSQPTGPITPHVPSGTPPSNDNYASAQLLTGTGGSVAGSNIGATLEPGEPNIQDTASGASVWYQWTVPVTGSYQFDTCSANPGYPSNTGLFIGSTVSTATEFEAGPSHDLCPPGEAGATIITSTMSAGLTLSIKVDGLNEDGVGGFPPYEGVFTLEWSPVS